MRKLLAAALVAMSIITVMAEPALARTRSTGSSSKAKASGDFIVRGCKTQACFKKHADGKYAVPLRKKKK